MLHDRYNSHCRPETRPAITTTDRTCMTNWIDPRPSVLESDRAVFEQLEGVSPVAAQILATGEISKKRLGDTGCITLMAGNQMVKAPLFVSTHRDTMMMTRWNGVFSYIPREKRAKLFKNEAKRLGLRYWRDLGDSNADFYSQVFAANGLFDSYMVLGEDPQTSCYVSGCLALGKPMFADLPRGSFFADWDFSTADIKKLNEKQLKERNKVWRKDTLWLTNDELLFLHDLLHSQMWDTPQ